MKLFLVRHGKTEENTAGLLTGQEPGVLTEEGKVHAQHVATALKDHHFAHIYCSDLKRCLDTADYIKKFHPNTPVTITKELRERNLGVFQGLKADSVDWDSLPGDVDTRKPEGGESPFELRTRALNFVGQLYKRHPNDNILLITHSGLIKHVLAHFLQTPLQEINKISTSHTQINEIEVRDRLTGKVLNY